MPPLASLTPLPRLRAQLSSSLDPTQWQASAAIDGDPLTLCASDFEGGATGRRRSWLSVQVPPGSAVEAVAVHNRGDTLEYMEWLSPFEVYVGASMGDISPNLAVRCGSTQTVPAAAGPFTVNCNGAEGEWVTLQLADESSSLLGGHHRRLTGGRPSQRRSMQAQPPRYLSIGELEIYGEPSPQRAATAPASAALAAAYATAATEPIAALQAATSAVARTAPAPGPTIAGAAAVRAAL